MAVYMAFLSAALGWGISQGEGMANGSGGEDVALPPDADVRVVYTIAVSFGYVFPLIVGALGVASEFRHQTITPTLLAEPRRSILVGAKVVSAGVLGLVYGLVGTLSAVGAGAAVLTLLDKPTFLDQGSTWRAIALSVLALALWAVIGVGFGSVLTNQVAVIVVVLAFTQFVEPVLRLTLGMTGWGAGISAYLPGAAGEAVSGGSFFSETGVGTLLPWWQGALVLLAYGLGLAAIGRVTTFRRDIT
jgi:hypothetical protein